MDDNSISEWNNAATGYSRSQENSPYSLFNKEYVKSFFVHDLHGFSILDAGCGDGYYANFFHKQGADVTGCDGSSEMLKIAKEKYPEIKYDLLDLEEELPYSDEQFDIIFCNQVLMDLKNLPDTIANFSRILKDAGHFYFSVVHPCFYLGDWETDDKGKKVYKKITNYLSHYSEKNNFWGTTTHYHRPVSDYLNILYKNNLVLERLMEPPIFTGGDDDSTLRIPLFLFGIMKKYS
ncbi:class I SAM-dependent methyltransferase [Methanolacinia paynteri]|uniref:class I SAM-dependent methyltransferase n=1 Tax=Methanolacinia paynteri TaxID=230356 RepID=UPI00069472E7|nr:class I SAM-dependent methyltransferase [Methanolacinia paynteri]